MNQDPGLSLLRPVQRLDTFVRTEVTRFARICPDNWIGLQNLAKNHQKNCQLEICLIPELLSRVDMKQIEFLNYKNMKTDPRASGSVALNQQAADSWAPLCLDI